MWTAKNRTYLRVIAVKFLCLCKFKKRFTAYTYMVGVLMHWNANFCVYLVWLQNPRLLSKRLISQTIVPYFVYYVHLTGLFLCLIYCGLNSRKFETLCGRHLHSDTTLLVTKSIVKIMYCTLIGFNSRLKFYAFHRPFVWLFCLTVKIISSHEFLIIIDTSPLSVNEFWLHNENASKNDPYPKVFKLYTYCISKVLQNLRLLS